MVISLIFFCPGLLAEALSFEGGIAKIENWTDEKNFIELRGEWNFSWKQLSSPDSSLQEKMSLVQLPSSFNKIANSEIDSHSGIG